MVIPALDERFRISKATAAAQPGAARIAPASAARPDWHNARARLMIDLNARLEALPSDAAREAMIESLLRSVEAGRAVDAHQGDPRTAAPV